MRIGKILLCVLLLALPVLAEEADDRQTATSLHYVSHELDTRQDKLSTGTNAALTYTNAAGGVQQRTVKENLNGGTTDTSLPQVNAVNAGLNQKQNDIAPIDDHTAVTYTNNVGTIGQKGIYQDSGTYATQTDNLIDAKTFNAALKNALDNEFVCADRPDAYAPGTTNCWLWEIHNATTDNTILPAGYTPLEYLESTGTQKISTQISARDGISIEVTLQGTGDRGEAFSFDQDWSGSGIHDRGTYYSLSSTSLAVTAVENQKNTLLYSLTGSSGNWDATLQFNDEIKTIHFTRGDMYGLTIFAGTFWNEPNSYWAGRIYSLIVRENSTITHNFVPARNSSGIAGMYDTVGRQFYPNANTDGEPFIGGAPDSSGNLYIPQNQQ